jgi:hypothetical protein
MAPLGYIEWRKFEGAIERAKEACKNSGQRVDDHFAHAAKMVMIGSEAKREVDDYSLSRYACYLIAQNGDPRKEEIALAQTYFALQTRKQEIQELLMEDQKRVGLRGEMATRNKKLGQAAKQAGVINYANFQDFGYMGLYGGMRQATTNRIPKGYKQTEAGVIPEDWSTTTLLKLSVTGISNGVFNDPAKVGSGYRLINVLDLYQGYSIDTKNLSRLQLAQTDFMKNKVKKGGVFFTRSSITPDGIGFCNFCNDDANDITFDGHIMKVTPNPEIANSAFLRLYCISKTARKFLVRNAKELSKNNFLNY